MARSEAWTSSGLHAGLLEAIGRRGEQRVDVEDVARRDPQHRLGLGPVVAVGDGRRRGLEAMGARRLGAGAEAATKRLTAAGASRAEVTGIEIPQAAGGGSVGVGSCRASAPNRARGLAISAPQVAPRPPDPLGEDDERLQEVECRRAAGPWTGPWPSPPARRRWRRARCARTRGGARRAAGRCRRRIESAVHRAEVGAAGRRRERDRQRRAPGRPG